jgi:hypothetical protein
MYLGKVSRNGMMCMAQVHTWLPFVLVITNLRVKLPDSYFRSAFFVSRPDFGTINYGYFIMRLLLHIRLVGTTHLQQLQQLKRKNTPYILPFSR